MKALLLSIVILLSAFLNFEGWASPYPQKRLLFLHGDSVTSEHTFFKTALEMAQSHDFWVDTQRSDQVSEILNIEDPRHAVLVFSSYDAYAELNLPQRALVDNYCRRHQVGLFFLYLSKNQPINDGQVMAINHARSENFRLSPFQPVTHLMKDGGVIPEKIFSRHLQIRAGEGYLPLLTAESNLEPVVTVMADLGKFDGIKRIFWGHDFGLFWMNELLFLDTLDWLSPTSLHLPRNRYWGLDIDDIFQPAHTSEFGPVKMQPEDVSALIALQNEIGRRTGSPFKSQIGFNSHWFERVYQPEKKDAEGDREFVKEREQFVWFDHLPEHQDATPLSKEQLEKLMTDSKIWAEKYDVLRLIGKYHVPPHHDGVANKHEPLFQAWKDIWKAESTSTVFTLKGFVHQGLMVMPRTDLGLRWNVHHWSQTNRLNLQRAARGGYLFRRIFRNPVSLVMTHQANFAEERPAVEVLSELVNFTSTWTTLHLHNLPSDKLVHRYFLLGAPAYQH